MGQVIPLGRLGEPVDIANAALFLASDLAVVDHRPHPHRRRRRHARHRAAAVVGSAHHGPPRPDERPPIEILGADLGVSSTQQVGARPAATEAGSRPDRWPSRRCRRPCWSAVLVLGGGTTTRGAAATGGARQPGADRPRQAARPRPRRRTTTTTRPTTTTTVPLGPLLGAAGGGRPARLRRAPAGRVVDLTTGAGRERRRCRAADPYDRPSRSAAGSCMPVSGRGAVTTRSSALARTRAGGRSGPADQVLPGGPGPCLAARLTAGGRHRPGPVTSTCAWSTSTGEVLRSFEVPGRYVSDATADEVPAVARWAGVRGRRGRPPSRSRSGGSSGTIGDAARRHGL